MRWFFIGIFDKLMTLNFHKIDQRFTTKQHSQLKICYNELEF